MKNCPSPKMEALEELAKAMAKLKLDKIKGYKKPKSEDVPEELLADEESEEEMPVLEAEAVEEDEDEAPKSFSKMLASLEKKKSKTH